jgi:hypothetical protein
VAEPSAAGAGRRGSVRGALGVGALAQSCHGGSMTADRAARAEWTVPAPTQWQVPPQYAAYLASAPPAAGNTLTPFADATLPIADLPPPENEEFSRGWAAAMAWARTANRGGGGEPTPLSESPGSSTTMATPTPSDAGRSRSPLGGALAGSLLTGAGGGTSVLAGSPPPDC